MQASVPIQAVDPTQGEACPGRLLPRPARLVCPGVLPWYPRRRKRGVPVAALIFSIPGRNHSVTLKYGMGVSHPGLPFATSLL